MYSQSDAYQCMFAFLPFQVAMLNKRCRLGVATLGGKIYACGGYDGSSFLRSVECFDPVANT